MTTPLAEQNRQIDPLPIAVRINGRTFPFTSYAEVSASYRATIDRLGLGCSQTPNCDLIAADGSTFGYVSYNGRVWRGSQRDWQPDKTPVFDPVGGAA